MLEVYAIAGGQGKSRFAQVVLEVEEDGETESADVPARGGTRVGPAYLKSTISQTQLVPSSRGSNARVRLLPEDRTG